MIYGGIDGCKRGWLFIYYEQGTYHYQLISHLSELAVVPTSILIDIPIGLTSATFTRTIEIQMRKELGHRSATVFNAPVRSAVYATSKQEARTSNIALTGKSLSEQSLNITPKIKEADQFIYNPKYSAILLQESHPELCFKYLKGEILNSKKSTHEGIEERLSILRSYDKRIDRIYKEILDMELRKDVKRDDIVDALCLCLVHRLGVAKGLNYLIDTNRTDDQGNSVSIAYFDAHTR